MQEFKYLVHDVIIAAGTGGVTSRIPKDITPGYERVVGIAFVEQANGGNSQYKVGFSDDNKQYVDPVPCDLLKFGVNLKMDDRFLPVDIIGDGNKVYVNLVLPNIPITDMLVSVTYKLLKGTVTRNCNP